MSSSTTPTLPTSSPKTLKDLPYPIICDILDYITDDLDQDQCSLTGGINEVVQSLNSIDPSLRDFFLQHLLLIATTTIGYDQCIPLDEDRTLHVALKGKSDRERFGQGRLKYEYNFQGLGAPSFSMTRDFRTLPLRTAGSSILVSLSTSADYTIHFDQWSPGAPLPIEDDVKGASEREFEGVAKKAITGAINDSIDADTGKVLSGGFSYASLTEIVRCCVECKRKSQKASLNEDGDIVVGDWISVRKYELGLIACDYGASVEELLREEFGNPKKGNAVTKLAEDSER